MFRSMPNWNALHPLIIHFPIALLLVAPLFVIIGAVLRTEKGRPFLITALILMALGTGGVFLAIETGEAAGKAAEISEQIKPVLEQHENLAETTRVVFSLLTLAFAALLFVPRVLGRELVRWVNTTLLAAFLMLYATGTVFLVHTAHYGGRLVHDLGVRAPVSVRVVNTAVADP
jgi:uncharacterized membrane protein